MAIFALTSQSKIKIAVEWAHGDMPRVPSQCFENVCCFAVVTVSECWGRQDASEGKFS
jgi:hypothetical protein